MVKRYGERLAVDGLTLTARRGEVTAILGPNGAGKTTTIETCEGYRRADGGTVRVLGLDPATDGRRLRPKVGVMLQSAGIPQSVPGQEYLGLLCRLHANPLDPRWLLEVVGLSDVAKTPFKRLSGGQQQRLSLAAAIIGRPELVFLDEPTAGMDPQARQLADKIIVRLNVSQQTAATQVASSAAEVDLSGVSLPDPARQMILGDPTLRTDADVAARESRAPQSHQRQRGLDERRRGHREPSARHVVGSEVDTNQDRLPYACRVARHPAGNPSAVPECIVPGPETDFAMYPESTARDPSAQRSIGHGTATTSSTN